MYFVYILYSPSTDTFYKGQTSHLEQRLVRHNAGYEKFTAKGVPWQLIWSTEKTSRKQAIVLEKKLKNMNREKLLDFIKKYSKGSSHDEGQAPLS